MMNLEQNDIFHPLLQMHLRYFISWAHFWVFSHRPHSNPKNIIIIEDVMNFCVIFFTE